MKQETKAIIIVCDGCGEHFVSEDGFTCFTDDPDGSYIEQEAIESEWLRIKDRHYCPHCFSLDEEDHYRTKDGKVWDADTEKEIEL